VKKESQKTQEKEVGTKNRQGAKAETKAEGGYDFSLDWGSDWEEELQHEFE
jgi:hypothetical protein